MTEDEKAAIEILKDNIGILEGKSSIRYTNYDTVIACHTILSLIEKQQKEIEGQGVRLLELAHKLTFDYISKDKIREILEKSKNIEVSESGKIINFYKELETLLEEN